MPRMAAASSRLRWLWVMGGGAVAGPAVAEALKELLAEMCLLVGGSVLLDGADGGWFMDFFLAGSGVFVGCQKMLLGHLRDIFSPNV